MAEDLEIRLVRVEERINAMQQAVELQAAEYERRLDALNGEAGRIRSIQESYVPRETYDAYVRDQGSAADVIRERVDETRQQLEKATDESIQRLEDSIKELETLGSRYVTRPEVAGGVAAMVAILGLLTQVHLFH